MTAELSPAQRNLIEMIEELGEGTEICLLKPRDVYDAMIVGVVERFNDIFVVYDKALVFEYLEREFAPESEDPEGDAADWYSFNMVGAWVGSGTWGFISGTKVLGPDGLADFLEEEPEVPSGGPD